MIRLTDDIWIGDSHDEAYADLTVVGVDAVLNVAQDLPATRGWKYGIEYMHVGLIDGPGNPITAYYAAVLALATLIEGSHVMVCCHSGSRSLAVVLMYLNVACYGCGLEECRQILGERVDSDLPSVHQAHLEAFTRMDWKLLGKLVER